MTTRSDPLTLLAAEDRHKPQIDQLLQLYLQDMAPYFGTSPGPDGRFDHDILSDEPVRRTRASARSDRSMLLRASAS